MQARAEGDVVGERYRVLEEIGRGGSSMVYRAQDERLGIEVALKVLQAPTEQSTLRSRMQTEAKTMMRLSHPHILQIHAVSPDGDWFAMDLSRRGSVADRVDAEGPLAPKQAIQLVLQLLSALEVAHDAEVVHRDVKPENLLLQADGTIKLCDFGIALVADTTRVTRAGFAMGSLPYMAPEQRVDPGKVDARADLYAVGATLYHLIAASTPVDLFLAPPSSPRFAGIPEGLVELIRKATSADPADRYQTAHEMAEALEGCLQAASDEPLVPAGTPPSAPQRVRTVVGERSATSDQGVAALEVELHKAWRDEEEQRRRESANTSKRLALVSGLMLFVLVLAGAVVFVVQDWVTHVERARGLESTDLEGGWVGTFGTSASRLELEGESDALEGTLTITGRDDRQVAGRVEDGWLKLRDAPGQGLTGRYRAELVDGGRLDGEYVTSEGRWVFHYVREP